MTSSIPMGRAGCFWRARVNRLAAAGVLVCVVGGCAPSAVVVDKPPDPTQERLMKIRQVYFVYVLEQHKPPASAADLQPALSKVGKVEELLLSPRDGLPFVICYGIDPRRLPTWAKSAPVLAYEKQGSGGYRYVITTGQGVQLLSDKDLREASFPPGQEPRF